MSKALSTEKTMTVKEVADILGVTTEAIKWNIRNIYPDLMKNGVKTLLTEKQVTKIKKNMIPTSQLVGAKTESEMVEKTMEVLTFWKQKHDELKLENEVLKPKALIADEAIRDKDKHYSIRDAGKHIGLNQKRIFEILRDHDLLTKKRLPTQKALNLGLLTLKTNTVDGTNRPQSVMTMENICNFNYKITEKHITRKSVLIEKNK